MLVEDGELLAGVDGILLAGGPISGQLVPQQRGLLVIAAALGEQCQIAAGLGAKLGRKTTMERSRAGSVCTIGIAAALQKPRQAKKIEAIEIGVRMVLDSEKRIDPAKKGRKAAQVHLIV